MKAFIATAALCLAVVQLLAVNPAAARYINYYTPEWDEGYLPKYLEVRTTSCAVCVYMCMCVYVCVCVCVCCDHLVVHIF